jgi:hydroxyacylglutathione hydrolase
MTQMLWKIFGRITGARQNRQFDAAEFRELVEEDVRAATNSAIIDVRSWLSFGDGHFPGSWNLYLENPAFAATAALFVDRKSPILLVSEGKEDARRAHLKLLKAGFVGIEGYIESRKLRSEHQITQLTVEDLKSTLSRGGKPQMLDVRTRREWRGKHIPLSRNVPLEALSVRFAEFSRSRPLVVISKDGFRSALAASWLQSKGFESVHHLLGGMESYDIDRPSEFSPAFWFATA